MLQHHHTDETTTPATTTHGFILSVELTDGVSPEHVRLKLADALTWVEGIGDVDVDYLGEVDRYPAEMPNETAS